MSKSLTRLIVIAAGGTGGHVFPAEALAAELKARGHELALVTDSRGGGYGHTLGSIPCHEIHSAQVTGRGVLGKVMGLMGVARGTLQVRGVLKKLRPGAVVGFGGYAAFPTTYAASGMGIPTVIHEQNGVLGRANRILAKRARFIATAFDPLGGLDAADRSKCVLVGNPVRPNIVALADRAFDAPEAGEPLNVLIMGGSQGARIFSEVIPAALEQLDKTHRDRLRISQQCRPEDIDEVRAAYAGLGMAPELESFFRDIPERLGEAHLVICRAGASTVAECTAAGRPTILVPYPFATDDHQTANARAVAAAGAGWMIPQPGFTADMLATRLKELLEVPSQLESFAAQARAFGQPRAAQKLADLVTSLLPATDVHGEKK